MHISWVVLCFTPTMYPEEQEHITAGDNAHNRDIGTTQSNSDAKNILKNVVLIQQRPDGIVWKTLTRMLLKYGK